MSIIENMVRGTHAFQPVRKVDQSRDSTENQQGHSSQIEDEKLN
jgi:hypothetical protein